jgi:menaquinone-9 beta-reductase
MADYDVAVVGASIAGSTAATLLGRAGLRVVLIERHRGMEAFKVLCTHHIMACAVPTIRRLGVDRDIEAAGGVRNGLNGYTSWGWITPPLGLPHGYSIRRQKLDPMLRRLAADTTGVDLLLGQRVTRLVDAGGAVGGVVLSGPAGSERTVRSRLVVGADGAHSTVAQLAGAHAKTAPNARFVYFAQFTGVHLTAPDRTHLWMHEPGITYAMPNDDGVTVLACMPTKPDLPAFQSNREAALLAGVRRMPDAPELDGVERVSKIVGTTDYPLVTRDPLPAPGVALVGDAALTSDPTQGVGCGWAFQSAEWLADAVAPALHNGGRLDQALRRYRRRRKALAGHQSTIETEARANPPTALDRLMLKAAVYDSTMAASFDAFSNRTIPVRRFLAPTALARAAWVTARPGGARGGRSFAG